MELVAGSYEQVLFGFTVHRGPAQSGHREVRHRESGAAGDRRADSSPPEPWRLSFIAGSPWRTCWKTDRFMQIIPALERLRQKDSELRAWVERSCSL